MRLSDKLSVGASRGPTPVSLFAKTIKPSKADFPTRGNHTARKFRRKLRLRLGLDEDLAENIDAGDSVHNFSSPTRGKHQRENMTQEPSTTHWPG